MEVRGAAAPGQILRRMGLIYPTWAMHRVPANEVVQLRSLAGCCVIDATYAPAATVALLGPNHEYSMTMRCSW